MARKIRFPLNMRNGFGVRTLEELRENFDMESVLGYFSDGTLKTWLEDRYYDEKAMRVTNLNSNDPDFGAKLCEILEVEYVESENVCTDFDSIQRKKEKVRFLSTITDDKTILDNVDYVAMNQTELLEILSLKVDRVYLFRDSFIIPFEHSNVTYVGIEHPMVIAEKDKLISDYYIIDVNFVNVRFEENVNPYYTLAEQLYIDAEYDKAFPLLLEAAEHGNPRAMYLVAKCYREGCGVIGDFSKCMEWLKKSLEKHEPLSSVCYEYYYQNRIRIMGFYRRIKGNIFEEELKKMAYNGDVLAQYVYGKTIENEEEDFILMTAEQGFAPSQIEVGWRYIRSQKEDIAVKWFEKAMKQGYVCAKYAIAYAFDFGCDNKTEYDFPEVRKLCMEVAEQGVVDAQFAFAEKCCWKMTDDKRFYICNDNESFEWYKKAAEQGHAYAQYMLGSWYRSGRGTERNYSCAEKWLSKSWEQGKSDALERLGELYASKESFNRIKAIEVIEKLFSIGQTFKGFCLLADVGGVESVKSYIDNPQFNGEAEYYLGRLYKYGYNGCQKSKDIAVEWFKKSLAKGYSSAEDEIYKYWY